MSIIKQTEKFRKKKTKSIINIKPKLPFKPVFQVAASRKGSDILIINEPLNGSAVFLVKTGEGRTQSYRNILRLLKQRRAFVSNS